MLRRSAIVGICCLTATALGAECAHSAHFFIFESESRKVTGYLDGAAQNGRIIQFFCHPHYLQDNSEDLPAVERVLKLIGSHSQEKGYQILYTSTNRIAAFWQARSASKIVREGLEIAVKAQVPMVIVLPEGAGDMIRLNGKEVPVVKKKVGDRMLSLLCIPEGENTLRLL